MGLLIATFAGCATPSRQSGQAVRLGESRANLAGEVTQAELQADVQRFVSSFMDRMGQALGEMRLSTSPRVREEAQRRALLYATSVLDIASDPVPELALLDLVVFFRLSHDALVRHWVPQLFHAEGRPMVQAFESSDPELLAIMDRVMSPQQQQKLNQLITRWQAEHPGQFRVEGVRFAEFAQIAGKIAKARAEDSQGLLSSVASGVNVADQALLMSERVLFLAQRMPFLLRMHASLGAGEVLSAIDTRFEQGGTLEGVLQDSLSLTSLAGQAAVEGRRLVEAIQPLVLPKRYLLGSYLASGNSLAEKLLALVVQLNAWTPQATREARGLLMMGLGGALLLGLILIGATFGAYYGVRRRLIDHQARMSQRSNVSSSDRAA